LSLWSYVNVYTDEGRPSGGGAGKEFCDLLVVFGDKVIIFSDKDCHFRDDIDIEVAWPRWYKVAIQKSARQLAGAEKFAREHPGRLYLDSMCEAPLPIPMPNIDEARYFLVAVTRGSHQAAAKYFGLNSSGSFMLTTNLIGSAHYERPFQIGYPLKSRRFMHVLDEVTVDALLGELDTASDLIDYLEAKEAWLDQEGYVSVSGEEDILARYMLSSIDGPPRLDLVKTRPRQIMVMFEGDWALYRNGPEQIGRRFANKQSYLWDDVIEEHSEQMRARGGDPNPSVGGAAPQADNEKVLRAMASESRLDRRQLANALFGVVMASQDPPQVHASMRTTGSPPSRLYVFLAIPNDDGEPYDDYRIKRKNYLIAYAHGFSRTLPMLREAICLASEPVGTTFATRDIIYVDLTVPLSADENAQLDQLIEELGILRPDSEVRFKRQGDPEFPIHRHIDTPELIEVNDPDSMMNLVNQPSTLTAGNRATRRAGRKKES
jgi:hypothetical protein